jgi:hypothetical protein
MFLWKLSRKLRNPVLPGRRDLDHYSLANGPQHNRAGG